MSQPTNPTNPEVKEEPEDGSCFCGEETTVYMKTMQCCRARIHADCYDRHLRESPNMNCPYCRPEDSAQKAAPALEEVNFEVNSEEDDSEEDFDLDLALEEYVPPVNRTAEEAERFLDDAINALSVTTIHSPVHEMQVESVVQAPIAQSHAPASNNNNPQPAPVSNAQPQSDNGVFGKLTKKGKPRCQLLNKDCKKQCENPATFDSDLCHRHEKELFAGSVSVELKTTKALNKKTSAMERFVLEQSLLLNQEVQRTISITKSLPETRRIGREISAVAVDANKDLRDKLREMLGTRAQ